MAGSQLEMGYIVCLSLRRGLLGIDPETGHFYNRSKQKRSYGKCARHVFLTLDREHELWLMNHSITCTAKNKRERHSHGPPPRPLVTLLLLRWYSIIHSLWNPVRVSPSVSVTAVYDEWIEDLPVSCQRAVGSFSYSIANWQKYLDRGTTEADDRHFLDRMEMCGPEVLKTAMTFYARTQIWPEREYYLPPGN